HFGDIVTLKYPAVSGTKLGSFILGMRDSPWTLTTQNGIVTEAREEAEDAPGENEMSGVGFESLELIAPAARVVSAIPFAIQTSHQIGLELRLSDGSKLTVVPKPATEADDARLADWELITPLGTLEVGKTTAARWTFQPA